MTPHTLSEEIKKVKADVPIYLYGGKPKFLDVLKRQIAALKDDRIHVLVQGKTYRF